jgi:hypothetical protein
VAQWGCAPNDGTPTAGTIILYDGLTATGAELHRFEVTASYFLPWSIPIQATAANGLFADFGTGQADVNCWASYR